MIDGDKELQLSVHLVESLGYPDDFAREFIMEMRYNRKPADEAFRRAARSSWISEQSREWAKARPEYKEKLLSELPDEELITRINAFTRALEIHIRFDEGREDSMTAQSIREDIEKLTNELDRRTQP